ncbi:MAG: DegV family protein [Eubacteriales bacterium]|nr:DegV family protein [Eubacteriales bacterium]
MKNVKIIIDSSADIPEEYLESFKVMPMKICFGDTEYTAGVDLTKAEFYGKLIESDTLPVTSQIKPFDYQEAFDEAYNEGEEVVVITISSKLSGTYQSALIAKSETKATVYVVDSLNVSIGLGILCLLALRLKKEGKSAGKIAEILEEEKKNVRVVALLNTLEYLKKGGRISAATAMAGTLLNMKPVVAVADGEVKTVGKARGSRQGNNLLTQEIDTAGGVDFDMPLLLGYTGLSDEMLKKYIEDSVMLWEGNEKSLQITSIGSIVGTHAGPDAIGAAFFAKNK